VKGYVSGIFLVVLVIGFFVITNNQKRGEFWLPVTSWQELTSPGKLSISHDFIKDDCGACHTAVKGPSPEKCMACHATDERLSIWPELQFHSAVPDCRRCHREHLGTGTIATTMDHDLIAKMSFKDLLRVQTEQVLEHSFSEATVELAADPFNALTGSRSEAELRCATCHFERDAHDRMFGLQCSSCHNTQVWMISKFRHPSSGSTDCSQCHRAPPCHFTSHFKKVCAPVAGQLNARVSDCHSCHQIPSWNSIKKAGWYKSH